MQGQKTFLQIEFQPIAKHSNTNALYRLDIKTFATLVCFLAGLVKNLVYGVCFSAKMAHKPVQTSSAKQTTRAYFPNMYSVNVKDGHF
jgi:hypothetical protein